MSLFNIFSKRHIFRLVVVGCLCGLLTACEDNFTLCDDTQNATEGGITFRCADMTEVYKGKNNPASRASGPKDEAEKRINTLHIFFFDKVTGELMTSVDPSTFPAYIKTCDVGFLKIPELEDGSRLFTEDADLRIVAIANIDATEFAADPKDEANSFYTDYSPNGKIAEKSREKNAEPYKIDNYSKLQKWIYYPRLRINEEDGTGNVRNLPKAGMPMIGEIGGGDNEHINITDNRSIVVNMTALMAKVYVSVKLDPDQYTNDPRALPEVTITEVGVMNMPIAVPFTQPTGMVKPGKTGGKPTSYDDYLDKYDVTNVSMVHPGTEDRVDNLDCAPELHEYTAKIEPVTITRDSDPALLSYYTYENIQLPDYNAKRTNKTDAFDDNLVPQYPDGVTEADKQRWKSTLAYKNRASALILKGSFTTHQEVDYQAKFTVYMGTDENIDFQVKRNHRYDNNITIYGMDFFRNSDDGVFNFDGRLNVVSDNPLYLAIVNERKVDAHASVLPLDVWLMMWEEANNSVDGDLNVNWRSEVTVEIVDPETHDWIRMDEIIPRSTMEGNNWKAGTGARDYFTTDLVTNTLAGGTKKVIKSDEHGSRSRIYFYIDENVPESNNPTDYGDRYATIKVNYKRISKSTNEVVESRDYTLDIEQRALLKVYGTHPVTNEPIPDTWMEYYEEYLSHNDPLDKHQMAGEYYSGLQWWTKLGDNLSSTNSVGLKDYTDVPTKKEAYRMTRYAVDKYNNPAIDVTSIKLYNTTAPHSVFHYSYGKNRRKDTGGGVDDLKINNEVSKQSPTKKWYMPGIRELEQALIMYYDVFPEMRNNFYWSSSGAPDDANTGYCARATSVTMGSNNTPIYSESGASGDPGYQYRTNYCRVRAFYRVD